MIDEISGDLLQWLRGFYFVVKEGGVRQAAIAMGRENSTISRQIRCLEKELGGTLFDRSSGKMVITPEGEQLLEEVVTLFEDVNRIKGGFKNEEIKHRGMIYIVASPPIISKILPPYIACFRAHYPEVTFKLEGTSREMICKKVESAEADFGIALSEVVHKTLVYVDLYESGLIILAPKNNRFFPGNKPPTLKQIAAAPLIVFSQSVFNGSRIKEQYARGMLTPNVVIINDNSIAIKEYVAQGIGVGIVSRHAISQEDEDKFDVFSLDPYFPKRRYGILLRNEKYLPARVKAFIRTIKPNCEFPANSKMSEKAPALPLAEFLDSRLKLSHKDTPTPRSGKGR